ncbi:putative bifunctional diguanylate cyclase/phosphodiesterase [Reinekea sp.]|uniref:putative bifunctional diguanylate cyclase/phosphodiesterase n=1 Tax=Reinekea sp. TaxID=1970455 RepID=UPI002A7F2828|nr:EAL domain-containing protein [Reinekea sp.]
MSVNRKAVRPLRLLMVDDDKVDREMVKRLLEKSDQNFLITEASGVDEGLVSYDQNGFDVVLLDYRMPQRDGIEMILELKTHTRDYGTAIIMMSSAEDEKLSIDCLEAGAQDFIPKAEITTRRLKNSIVHAQTRFKLEKELRDSYLRSKDLAEKDGLTGLANRFVFEEALKTAVANNVRDEFKLGLLLFDIDDFKYVNDVHGHDVGDEILKLLCLRVSNCLRGGELFSRLGGDEFAIIISNLKGDFQLAAISKRILKALELPIETSMTSITLDISIGMAIHPDNTFEGKELIKCADIAMYRAKAKAGSQACFFHSAMQVEYLRRYNVESILATAIDNNLLSLVYQPVFNPQKMNIIGFEALLRLQDYSGNMIYPDEFIPIAEQSGLIVDIGEWVLINAIKQLKVWQQSTGLKFTMAINLSPIQLESGKLLSVIEHSISHNSVDPIDVEFEITETAVFKVNEETIGRIQRINSVGCRIALDDFGTGYSSISHLLLLPIKTVKLDRSMMPTAGHDENSIKLVKAMISLVSNLELEIVAEGIEDEFQFKLMLENHVDKAQGYYFSKPLDVAAVEKLFL